MQNRSKVIISSLIAALITFGLTELAHSRGQTPFADVKPDAWYFTEVADLEQRGIIKGYPNGYFQPRRTVTRAEVAILLDRTIQYMEKQNAKK